MIEYFTSCVNKILSTVKNYKKDVEDIYGEKWHEDAVVELYTQIHQKYSRIWKDTSVQIPVLSQETIRKTNWYGTDSEENFKKNPNKTYKKDSILYKINSEGYRIYDDNRINDERHIIACFGCSNTFGVGLPDEHTWPYALNQKIGFNKYKCLNYGVSGASNDLIARLIYNYLNNNKSCKTKPKAIVCYLPEIYRIEYYTDYSPDQFPLRLAPTFYPPCTQKDYKNYRNFVTPEYAFFNFVKNYKFIETLCNLHNIPLIWHTWSPTLLYFEGTKLRDFIGSNGIYKSNDRLLFIKPDPHARDGKHAGYTHNQILAEEFFVRLKSERNFGR